MKKSERRKEIEESIKASDALVNRLDKCIGMIGEMCAEGRPPSMTIPPQWYDEDMFICATIKEAISELSKQTPG